MQVQGQCSNTSMKAAVESSCWWGKFLKSTEECKSRVAQIFNKGSTKLTKETYYLNNSSNVKTPLCKLSCPRQHYSNMQRDARYLTFLWISEEITVKNFIICLLITCLHSHSIKGIFASSWSCKMQSFNATKNKRACVLDNR